MPNLIVTEKTSDVQAVGKALGSTKQPGRAIE